MLNSQTSGSAKRDLRAASAMNASVRSQQIAIRDPAGEPSVGYLRRDHARDQKDHADVPESVQHKKRPERFRALAFAYRRPNILRGNNAPEEKAECCGDVPNERDWHDALLSSPRA
jgi:hypothetical protein